MKKKVIFELVSNLVIFIMLIVSFVIIFATDEKNNLIEHDLSVFKYFTVDSNVFMGLMAFVSLFFINKKTPLIVSILKYVATCSVSLTFLTVMVYLGPLYGFPMMLAGANLFMHLLIPVLAIIHLFLLEPKMENYKFSYTIYSILPMILYGIGYLTNIAVHNGYGDIRYDWYFFGQGGIWIGILMFFLMAAFSYVIGVALYFGYKKIKVPRE